MSLSSQAQLEGRILSHSASKQTVLVNLGRFEELKEGEFVVITKEISQGESSFKAVPVAKGRVVRVGTTQSVFVLFKIYDPELIVKDQPFLIFSETQSLKGRSALKLTKRELIADEKELSKDLKNLLDQDELNFRKDGEYRPSQTMHQRSSLDEDQASSVDVTSWTDKKDKKIPRSILKSEKKEIIQRQVQLREFESIVTSYLLRVNKPGFRYETFYPDRGMKFSSAPNDYQKYVDDQERQKTADIYLLKKILEKGETWSSDHSDEELAQLLKDTSLVREFERKKEAMSLRRKWMLGLVYHNILTDDQTDSDQSHRQKRLYEISSNVEWAPFEKKIFQRFSFDFGIGYQKNAFSQGNLNALTTDKTLSLGLNYYFHHYLYSLEELIFLGGFYLKTGDAFVSLPATNDKSNYSVMSAPGFKLELKYNFRNQVGIGLRYSFESTLYDKYSSNSFSSALPDKKYLNISKVGLALTTIF